MAAKTSYTFKPTPEQQERIVAHLSRGNYRQVDVPYTRIAADGDRCRIALYTSGKLVVQGQGAEHWVTFTLEPDLLGEVVTGYDEVLNPEAFEPHFGIDESGKGDFFGPMVIAGVYTDADAARALNDAGIRDSKTVSSDKRIFALEKEIHKIVGDRSTVVAIGPAAYNRLHAKMGSVNKVLAWGHARAIENLLEKVPDCPRALADQFGPEHQIRRALLQHGRKIELAQRHKAESDPAVAAASIVARAAFVRALVRLSRECGVDIPKGASAQVRAVAEKVARDRGAEGLREVVKWHFKTTGEVLRAAGLGG